MATTTGMSQGSVFKASEVCVIAGVKPFILRSWQTEFPELGALRGRSRVYRQADVELVLEIKRLLFEEGLTLGAARRQIESNGAPADGAGAPAPVAAPLSGKPLGPEARERIIDVKRGLEALLGLLSATDEPASGARLTGSPGAGRRRPRRRPDADAPAS